MEILLPKLADSGSGMHWQGEGVVLRSSQRLTGRGHQQRGFAASGMFYPEATEAVLSQLKTSGQIV